MTSASVVVPARRSARWLVVVLLTLGVIIAYTDRINLSAALPAIRMNFPLSAAASGVLLSAFFWAYTVLQTPAGWVVDRFGLKWPYAAALFVWSAVSAATALVSSLHGLIAIRIILGAGEAIVAPASIRYIRENFAEHERGLPIGVYFSGTKYGPAIGAPIATYLVLGYGWRWMFVLNGAIGFLWLIPWLLLARDDRRNSPVQGKGASVSWSALLSAPFMWGTCIATFCYMYFVYFCMTWMPTYFKERYGFSLAASGWFTFMSFAGMGTIAILAGWAADRLIARGRNARDRKKSIHHRRLRAGLHRGLRSFFTFHCDHSFPGRFFAQRARPGHGQLLGAHPDVDAGLRLRSCCGHTKHRGQRGRDRRPLDHRDPDTKDRKF